MSQRTFTTYQIAELLGQTPGTVVEWIQKGWLPVRRMPDGAIRISEQSLVGFLRDRGVDLAEIMAGARVEPAPEPEDEEASARRARKLLARRIASRPAGEPPSEAESWEPDVADSEPARPDVNEPVEPEPVDPRPDEGRYEPEPQPEPETPAAHEAGPEPSGADEPRPSPVPEAEPALDELEVELRSVPEPEPRTTPEAHPQEAEEPQADDARPARADQVIEAVLADALAKHATAVHFEPRDEGLSLRLRVDGVLREKPGFAARLPGGLDRAILERLAGRAGLDAEALERPAEGLMEVPHGDTSYHAAVATCPTARGPRVVLRLRPADAAGARAALGEVDRARLMELLTGGGVWVVLAGPTRSGRRALLCSLAGEAAAAGCSVLVLGRQAGAAGEEADDVPAGGRNGLAYAEAMSAAVGQDADLVCVEDLRDPGTALEAFEAAREGASVVAAVRAADAAEAVGELLAMGLEPWPLSRTLAAVVVCPAEGGPVRLRIIDEAAAEAIRRERIGELA